MYNGTQVTLASYKSIFTTNAQILFSVAAVNSAGVSGPTKSITITNSAVLGLSVAPDRTNEDNALIAWAPLQYATSYIVTYKIGTAGAAVTIPTLANAIQSDGTQVTKVTLPSYKTLFTQYPTR